MNFWFKQIIVIGATREEKIVREHKSMFHFIFFSNATLMFECTAVPKCGNEHDDGISTTVCECNLYTNACAHAMILVWVSHTLLLIFLLIPHAPTQSISEYTKSIRQLNTLLKINRQKHVCCCIWYLLVPEFFSS